MVAEKVKNDAAANVISPADTTAGTDVCVQLELFIAKMEDAVAISVLFWKASSKDLERRENQETIHDQLYDTTGVHDCSLARKSKFQVLLEFVGVCLIVIVNLLNFLLLTLI